jgi:hypothetical protein
MDFRAVPAQCLPSRAPARRDSENYWCSPFSPEKNFSGVEFIEVPANETNGFAAE